MKSIVTINIGINECSYKQIVTVEIRLFGQ